MLRWRTARLVLSLVGLLLGLAVLLGRAAAVGGPAPVDLLTVDGAIDPITAQYVDRGLAQAAQDGAQLVLIELNTPGGLDDAMRRITGAMLRSPVPVAVYVTPAGGHESSFKPPVRPHQEGAHRWAIHYPVWPRPSALCLIHI